MVPLGGECNAVPHSRRRLRRLRRRRAVEAAADQVGPDGTVHVVTAFHPESDNRLVEHLRQLPEEFRYVYDEDALEKERQHVALAMLQERGVDPAG